MLQLEMTCYHFESTAQSREGLSCGSARENFPCSLISKHSGLQKKAVISAHHPGNGEEQKRCSSYKIIIKGSSFPRCYVSKKKKERGIGKAL